jgi:hypothetical protein
MKKLLFAMLVYATGIQISTAQDCGQFINAVNGKKLIYTNLDPKGKEQGRVSYTTTKVNATTVNFHSEITDKNGKTSGSGDSQVICDGASLSVDMKSFVPPGSSKQFSNMTMQADGKYLMYPIKLSAGQTLQDGSADITVDNNGSHFADILIDITNRKVEQQESVTTDAGSFDCFRITYDISVKAKVMGIGIPVNMHVIEWFSPKIGRTVKSETYSKGGKLAGTMQLVSIN